MALYSIWVNVNAGVIILTYVYSPKKPYLDEGTPPPEVPAGEPLHTLSDFVYLCYLKACKGDPACMQRFKWWIVVDVRNARALDAARKCILYNVAPCISWPGHPFSTTDKYGQALLGCPVGYGLAWMLGNHKDRFGPKTVDTVNIVFADQGVAPTFAYHVRDNTPSEPHARRTE